MALYKSWFDLIWFWYWGVFYVTRPYLYVLREINLKKLFVLRCSIYNSSKVIFQHESDEQLECVATTCRCTTDKMHSRRDWTTIGRIWAHSSFGPSTSNTTCTSTELYKYIIIGPEKKLQRYSVEVVQLNLEGACVYQGCCCCCCRACELVPTFTMWYMIEWRRRRRVIHNLAL